ncbi:MAG: hypothetical protein JWP10_1817 [Nocardioidaceae bacterium]|nr:hypothetical protein [Nocardioidaceae bacterium]
MLENMTTNFAYHQMFDSFLAEVSLGRQRVTRQRYQRVFTHLDLFLDHVDVTPHLGTHPAALLSAEREFDSAGAFQRVFGPFELMCCLPGFIEPPWLLPGAQEARVQVSLTGRLLAWLRTNGYVDVHIDSCAYLETKSIIDRARRALP